MCGEGGGAIERRGRGVCGEGEWEEKGKGYMVVRRGRGMWRKDRGKGVWKEGGRFHTEEGRGDGSMEGREKGCVEEEGGDNVEEEEEGEENVEEEQEREGNVEE